MGAGGSNQSDDSGQRYNSPAHGGGGRRTKDRFHRHNQNAVSPKGTSSLWSKITIPFGKNYEKDFILKTLLNASKSPFIPIYYHIQGNSAVFFVEDAAAADNLVSLNKKITLHDGHKLTLIVKFSPAPNLPMDSELKEKIKLVMARRYNSETLTLNLSQFHLDEELCTQYYTPLSRDNVLQTVVDIIGEHIPNVVAIDASNNKIFNLDQMKPLITKTPSLRSLNLGKNKLVQISKLDRLSGLPLEELILNQNPLCDTFNEQSTYISAVRKRFPKLMRLDGVELPPVISFDIGAEDIQLPASKGNFFISEDSRRVVLIFLEQFLGVYDSDDRQPLLHAYHDAALMSLTCSPPGQSSHSSARLDAYLKDSRNLKRIDDTQRRHRLLHQGKVDIVAFINKLPKTTHDPTSLTVDVPVASNHLMVASVTGLFREREQQHSTIRFFQRVFVIVPFNEGFCIVNEQFHIMCATPEQVKNAFKEQVAVQAPAAPVSVVAAAVNDLNLNPWNPAAIDPKQQMIIDFSQQSGMNQQWSSKCLEENNWDFETARNTFNVLFKSNMVPPEAFIK